MLCGVSKCFQQKTRKIIQRQYEHVESRDEARVVNNCLGVLMRDGDRKNLGVHLILPVIMKSFHIITGFIDFIVDPSLGVCGDLLDKVASLSAPPATPTISEEPSNGLC